MPRDLKFMKLLDAQFLVQIFSTDVCGTVCVVSRLTVQKEVSIPLHKIITQVYGTQ